jgi:hypothetical protein
MESHLYVFNRYTRETDTVLDFCAGTMSTACTALALNRSCISIEPDEGCFHEALRRLKGFIEWITEDAQMEIGNVDSKQALNHISCLQPHEVGENEEILPLGSHNYPSYESLQNAGLSQEPPCLEEDAVMHNLTIEPSKLPNTVDGPAGSEAIAARDFDKGEVVAHYWGEFIVKSCSRYRKIKNQGSARLMTMSNLPFMSNFVIQGHVNCAAVYIQSSQYEGPQQDDIEANVVFLEQKPEEMNPLRPHHYIQAIALRYRLDFMYARACTYVH